MGILMLGAGLQGTLLGLRATLEGFPTPVTGLIMSCYYVGYLLGTLIAPRLLRRVGHVRVFAALAALASVASLVHASWVHPLPWGAMRLVSGLCFAGIYVVAESWLNHRASRTNRGRLLAAFMAVSILAAVLTQYPVGRVSDRMDRRTVIASVCTLATLVAAGIVAFGPLPRPVFLLLAALFSGSALTLYSLAVSHVNDKLQPAQMVAASSALLLLNGMAAAFGPGLTGSPIPAFRPRA